MQATRTAPTPRVARGSLPIATIVILVVVIVFGPAFVATTVTARQQPGSFVTAPWRGWQLIGSVITAAPGAELPSPGAALERARATWTSEDGFAVSEARLVFLPGDSRRDVRGIADSSSETAMIEPGNPLAWIVEGSNERTGTRAVRVLGVLDYSSGDVRYDAREREETTNP